MNEQNTKTKEQKQYTTTRILTPTHEKIKKIASYERRTIDIVINRLLDEALTLPTNSEILSQVQ